MRLIDADAFKTLVTAVTIADGLSGGFLNEFCRLIDSQKTAYDVGKVAGQLRELNENEFTYERVMNIVKAGGVNGKSIADSFQRRDGSGHSGRQEDGDAEGD